MMTIRTGTDEVAMKEKATNLEMAGMTWIPEAIGMKDRQAIDLGVTKIPVIDTMIMAGVTNTEAAKEGTIEALEDEKTTLAGRQGQGEIDRALQGQEAKMTDDERITLIAGGKNPPFPEDLTGLDRPICQPSKKRLRTKKS